MDRGFRPRQKGIECSVDGCIAWCVSNDMCPKHNMQAYRRTEKGKVALRKSNLRYKRPDINKVCPNCGRLYITARESQRWCSACSKAVGAYEAQKAYRKKNIKKVRARGIVNKRVERGTLKKELCIVCDGDAESHHHNYDKPLDITWLCKDHHGMLEAI